MLREERPYESLSERMTRDSWIIIFADLLALLLTFFVLIFSMNTLEVKNWNAITDSFANQLDRSATHAGPRSTPIPGAVLKYEAPAISLDYLSTLLRNGLREKGLIKTVRVTRLEDSLVISLLSSDVYTDDPSKLNPRGQAIVFEMAALLTQLKNSILVIGHAAPGEAEAFGDLGAVAFSLKRANSVAIALQSSGYTRPFEVLGQGRTRYDRIAPAASVQRRNRLASRVDVVIMERGPDG